MAPVKGDVRLNSDLLFGLLLWSQVSLCGLSLGNGEDSKTNDHITQIRTGSQLKA